MSKLVSVLLAAVFATPCAWAQQPQYNSNDVTPVSAAAAKLTGAGTGKQVGGGNNGHAYLLTQDSLADVDLHPASGYSSSMALSTDDTQQCGYAFSTSTFGNHAMLWSGSAASAVDLHTMWTWTYCAGTDNGQQVGFGERPVYFMTTQHAMLWTGTAASGVDIHPLGYAYSKALGIRGGQQVGYGSTLPYPGLPADFLGYHTSSHALLWTGTAASAVDLNPAGYSASEANATNGVQQGGWALEPVSLKQHAALWSGTFDTFVDLHPSGFSDSKVNALTPTIQVGEGWVGGMGLAGAIRHALVWRGTPESVVDLNQYLPPGYTNGVATGVDGAGNVVGYAYNTADAGGSIPTDAIAVVFAPGAVSPYALASLSLDSASVTPQSTVQGTLSIAAPAPADISISFLASDPALLSVPTPITIVSGLTSVRFTVSVNGSTLRAPTVLKLIATDGKVRKGTQLNVVPVVNVATVSANAVEGGFQTSGTVTLGIPAQAGGAIVSLNTDNTSLASVPMNVTIAQGQTQISFPIATSSVAASTTVAVNASLNGRTVSTQLGLTQAPIVSVASLSVPPIVGGQPAPVTLTMSNFPRDASGATVTLTSSDTRVLLAPATVNVPYGMFSVTFNVPTNVVQSQKAITLAASYKGSTITTTFSVAPIPTITIIQADYLTDTHLFKVGATTSFANSTLSFGTDPLSAPIGTMQFELGQFNGAAIMATAPKYATVWNSNGGVATVLVTVKASAGGGGGGGGGGSSYKLTVTRNGKGTVTQSPSASSYTAGSVVKLTATPDAGSTWTGWAGACSGMATTCTVTMNSNLLVSANFR